jgi:hypothetical protein
VHDELRGGDVDLLVELPAPAEDALGLSVRIAARIERHIGLRKIEVLIADPASCCEVAAVYREGLIRNLAPVERLP